MGEGTARLIEASFNERGARGPDRYGNYYLCCPFCEDRKGKIDVKYKLSANPTRASADGATKGGWLCWRCDARGWGGLEFLGEALIEEQKGAAYLGEPDGFVPFNGNHDALSLEPYRRYLRGRGVFEFAEAIGAGACLTGRFEGRVVVPHIVAKRWQGFSARTVVGHHEPKYLYPAGMERRTMLWGLEWAPHDAEPLWIVEGVFDALPLFPYGIATFGKTIAPEQLAAIAELDRDVVIALDGDAWMECRALAYRVAMRRGFESAKNETRWAHLPPTTDPGQLGWDVKKYIQHGATEGAEERR